MTLRLELFVNDLSISYCWVLGFKVGERQSDGYTLVTNGEVQLGLCSAGGKLDTSMGGWTGILPHLAGCTSLELKPYWVFPGQVIRSESPRASPEIGQDLP